MKEIILQTLIFTGWLAYANLEGIREAYYYKMSSHSNFRAPNLHPSFFMQRFFVATVCCVPLNNILLLIPMALCFSYIHNGSYYCERNDLDYFLYQKRWRDNSTTSTAIFEFSYKNRLIQFIVGILAFVSLLIYKFY